jgi:hypothetical protein
MNLRNQKGGVWQYLEETGVLEHGTPEEIGAARAEYWKAYKRKWKKEQRTVYTISLTHKEVKELERAATRHHRASTTFIREALFAYLNQRFIVPDTETVREVRMLLARSYYLLQTIQEEGNNKLTNERALSLLEKLEADVLRCLTAPDRSSEQLP